MRKLSVKRSRPRAIKLLNYIHEKNGGFDQIDNLIKQTCVHDGCFIKNNRTIKTSTFYKAKFECVPIDMIVTRQSHVSKRVLHKKIQGKWPDHTPEDIHLIYWRKKYYIYDGNHRVNRDKLLGKEFVKARVVYADKHEDY